jgi:hypothetical protein
VIAYFLGAIFSHLRKQDRHISAAVALLVLAAAVLVIRVLSI